MTRHTMLTFMMIATLLAGCNVQTSNSTTATSTPTQIQPEQPPTQTATATIPILPTTSPTSISTPADCNPDKVVTNLKSFIPYKEFEVNYTDIKMVNTSTLNVWYVDPQIDPATDSQQIENNVTLAIHDAAVLSTQLVQADRCIALLFKSGINPVVVDRNYNGWFSGIIPTSSLPKTQSPTEKELSIVETAFKIQYVRKTAPQSISSPPSSSCTWPEFRANLQRHFSIEQANTSFYLVHDETGVNVYAQWMVPSGYDDKITFAYSVASIQNILYEIPCLYPKVDILNGFGLDESGDLKFLGRMTGAAIQKQDIEQLRILFP